MKFFSFLSLTHRKLISSNKLAQFLILISFLISFGLARLVTHLQRANLLPNQSGALHIHHLVPGIFLLLFSGYIGISYWSNTKLRYVTSILFGIGAALTIDEFALWLFLQDVYWARRGRDSVDAVIITTIIFALLLLISEVHNHAGLKKLLKKF